MSTNLTDWYPVFNEAKGLPPLMPETIILPADSTEEEINRTILYLCKKPEYFGAGNMPIIGPQPGVFFRVNEVSPKVFTPCKSADDVFDALLVPRAAKYPDSHLCFRKYVPNIATDYVELRCFISAGRCTAITQNDAQVDSEPLDEPEKIKCIALEFAGVCRKRLAHLQNYTIDIAIHKQTYWRFVVEINSSHREDACTGLFDENSPSDMAQLDRGIIPKFRYFTSIFLEYEEI